MNLIFMVVYRPLAGMERINLCKTCAHAMLSMPKHVCMREYEFMNFAKNILFNPEEFNPSIGANPLAAATAFFRHDSQVSQMFVDKMNEDFSLKKEESMDFYFWYQTHLHGKTWDTNPYLDRKYKVLTERFGRIINKLDIFIWLVGKLFEANIARNAAKNHKDDAQTYNDIYAENIYKDLSQVRDFLFNITAFNMLRDTKMVPKPKEGTEDQEGKKYLPMPARDIDFAARIVQAIALKEQESAISVYNTIDSLSKQLSHYNTLIDEENAAALFPKNTREEVNSFVSILLLDISVFCTWLKSITFEWFGFRTVARGFHFQSNPK